MKFKVQILIFVLAVIFIVGFILKGEPGRVISEDNFPPGRALNLMAGQELKKINHYFEDIIANEADISDISLPEQNRQSIYLQYKQNLKLFKGAMAEYDKFIRDLPPDKTSPQFQELWLNWNAYKFEANFWLKMNDEFSVLFETLQPSLFFDHESLWADLQKYQDEHFAMVRAASEMVWKGQTTGPKVQHGDMACALYQWQIKFLEQAQNHGNSNPIMVNAVKRMDEHHHRFNLFAGKIYALIKQNKIKDNQDIESISTQLLIESNAMAKYFLIMREEIKCIQGIYRTIKTLRQDEMAPAIAKCKILYGNLANSQEKWPISLLAPLVTETKKETPQKEPPAENS